MAIAKKKSTKKITKKKSIQAKIDLGIHVEGLGFDLVVPYARSVADTPYYLYPNGAKNDASIAGVIAYKNLYVQTQILKELQKLNRRK